MNSDSLASLASRPAGMSRRSALALLLGGAAGAASAAADSAPRIRIAQVGTSHSHASGKMAAVRALADLYEVAGIAETDAARQATAAKSAAYAGLAWKTEDELLQDATIRAVVVELNLDEAAQAAHRAVKAGKHVHLDKPGAATHALYKAMREEAESRGLTVQMGYMLRYNPAFELLARVVREGWLGEITEIDASMGKLAEAGMRKSMAAYPGSGMFELACHLVDAVVTLMGKPAAVHAFGHATRAPEDPVLDSQMAVLEYPKATAVIRCNHADPFGGPRRRFSIAGTKGAVEIEPLESGRMSLSLTEDHEPYKKGTQKLELKVPSGRYDGEFRDLARVIRGEKKLAWSAAHDIAVHETAMKAAGI